MKQAYPKNNKIHQGVVLQLVSTLLYLIGSVAIADDTPLRINWSAPKDGLQRATLLDGKAHAFRIDLRRLKLTVSQSSEGKYVHELAESTKAVLAVNGNFFDPEYRAQGLLISEYAELSRFKKVDWGVFAIKAKRASLVHSRQWNSNRAKKAEFAVQCGPRLVVNYRVLNLKTQWARRTAIGIEKNPHYVLMLVVDKRILTSDLAQLMKNLGARYAMNLDGGSSTQLWTHDKSQAKLKGVRVANAILVTKR